jgi:hypothetical protein
MHGPYRGPRLPVLNASILPFGVGKPKWWQVATAAHHRRVSDRLKARTFVDTVISDHWPVRAELLGG